MKTFICYLVLSLSIISFGAHAEKPKWAGQKAAPAIEERTEHKDAMTSKNDEKAKNDKEKKAKGLKDEGKKKSKEKTKKVKKEKKTKNKK